MVIEESIVINAPMERVWSVFTDLTRWKDWNRAMGNVAREEADTLVEGGRLSCSMRPFLFPVNLDLTIEEVKEGARIVWSGKVHGISARHEFVFDEEGEAVRVMSRETFSGKPVEAFRFFFPEWRVRGLTVLMLRGLKKAAER